MAIAVDQSGTIYMSGFFGDHVATASAIFGPGEANQTTLTSVGGSDIFVATFVGQ
jgi:hypothetical protein